MAARVPAEDGGCRVRDEVAFRETLEVVSRNMMALDGGGEKQEAL